MSVTTLAEAKLHLRVDGSEEDTLIQVWLDAAERLASEFMDRNVYADASALTSAVSGATAALSAATSVYVAACDAAELLTSDVERAIAIEAAERAYGKAQASARRTHEGVVMSDLIKAAVLLTVGNLYANRDDATQELPVAARHLLQPLKSLG